MHRGTIELDVITALWLLIIAFGAMMVVRRTKVPYTVALVVAGLLVGSTHLLKIFYLSKELVFAVFLPPLLFDAAIRLPVGLLKRNWKPVALLAVPGVVASTFIVGYAGHMWAGLSLMAALTFGALISATDPVSVLSLFKSLKVERRLSILVEGESLFNDGTAAVLYASLLGALIAGKAAAPAEIGLAFARAIVTGVLVGGGIGWLVSLIMARLDDHLVEITLTTIAAYGSSLLAEAFGASGVISVISAGIVLGYYRSEAAMSATTQAAVYSFWEYVAFAINSFLFLLIGIDVTIAHMAQHIAPMIIAVAAAAAARVLVVYSAGAVLSGSYSRIPFKWQHVLNFGGLRGALAIALALGLPPDLPGRDTILAMTYAVVLWTLLPQGLSMGWILKKLGLAGKEEGPEEYGRVVTRLLSNRAGLKELDKLRSESVVSRRVYDELFEHLSARIGELEQHLEKVHEEYGAMTNEERREVKLRILAARSNAIRDALESGIISESAARELQEDNLDEYSEKAPD